MKCLLSSAVVVLAPLPFLCILQQVANNHGLVSTKELIHVKL